MSLDPLKQFAIKPLIEISVMGYDLSFTNASFFMIMAFVLLLIIGLSYKRAITICDGITKINRLQAACEIIYDIVLKTISGTCGNKGLKYAPEIFTVYVFIMFCNILGLLPGGFTVTSHIIVTFAIALAIFLMINVIGFMKHGWHYFTILLPKGTPMFLAPLMIIIELFTYLSRPFSLALRLAANMTAGHIVLKVFAAFVVLSGIAGIFPFAMLIILTGFELFVAVLQAYIFTILACVYLNDAINMH